MRCRLDETSAILTFIYENNNNGIESILFKYDPLTDQLFVGGYLDHQKGGGSALKYGLYSFIRCRAFSPTRFGVYYEDRAALGSVVLAMGEMTAQGGLVDFGPQIALAPPPGDLELAYYWANLAPATAERFFVMESVTLRKSKLEPHGSIHVGEVYPFPLGIVTEMNSKEAVVTVDGVYKFPGQNSLKKGKEYMGNSNGELIEGDYVGLINNEAYTIYVNNEEKDQILSTESQIGFAISDSELFIRIPDNIEV